MTLRSAVRLRGPTRQSRARGQTRIPHSFRTHRVRKIRITAVAIGLSREGVETASKVTQFNANAACASNERRLVSRNSRVPERAAFGGAHLPRLC
jgi:hypothetical protein